jgi:hypothetical protein
VQPDVVTGGRDAHDRSGHVPVRLDLLRWKRLGGESINVFYATRSAGNDSGLHELDVDQRRRPTRT